MSQAKTGDNVKVHYTGRLEDGTVFDTSVERAPLQFKIGEGHVIPGFEQAVVGMNQGESKTTIIMAAEAYGLHHKEMVWEVERGQFPQDLQLEVGQRLQVSQPNSQPVLVEVTNISESNVTLDANHPLAGKDLTFDIELVEIV